MSTNVDQLVLAVERGDLPAVKRLALQVADVNAACSTCWTALQRAAYDGHLPVAQWLVREARADVDRAHSNGCTPLYLACESGKPQLAQFLISADADVDLADVEGTTPLSIAATKHAPTLI